MKHSRYILSVAFCLALALSLGACSSTKPEGGDTPTDEFPAADAGTDAVPVADAEAPLTPSGDSQALEQMAADPLAPAADPVQESSSSVGTEDYTVQSGDTLMKIAFETYGDIFQWKKIYEANRDKLSSPAALSKGMVLKLEKPASPVAIERNGERYLIKRGDTLGTISQDVYGTKTKWRAIWENNRTLIKDPNRIYAGFYLYYTADGSVPAKPADVTPQPLGQEPAQPQAPVQGAPADAAVAGAPVGGGDGSQIAPPPAPEAAPPTTDNGAPAPADGQVRMPAADQTAPQDTQMPDASALEAK